MSKHKIAAVILAALLVGTLFTSCVSKSESEDLGLEGRETLFRPEAIVTDESESETEAVTTPPPESTEETTTAIETETTTAESTTESTEPTETAENVFEGGFSGLY